MTLDSCMYGSDEPLSWLGLRRLFSPSSVTGLQPESEPRPRFLSEYRWVFAIDADSKEIRALDAQDLERKCPLDNGRHDVTAASTDQGHRTFSLPAELLWSIIKHMDIPTLTTFRRVSKHAMSLVDETLEYKHIMKHAPQIIRGALTLEANSFSLNDAYITLSDDDACATCNRRGGYIYLITCERVCSKCLIDEPRWKPRVDIDKDWDRYGQPRYPDPQRVPSVVGRPGTYGTPGGYPAPGVRYRDFPYEWVRKRFSSRLWDAKHCGDEKPYYRVPAYFRTGWHASACFVSVSVPLVDRTNSESARKKIGQSDGHKAADHYGR